MSYHDTFKRISETNLWVSSFVIQACYSNTCPIWIGTDANVESILESEDTTPEYVNMKNDEHYTGISLFPGDFNKYMSSDQKEVFNLRNFYIQGYEDHAKANIIYWIWDGKIYPALQRSDATPYDQVSNTWTVTNGIPQAYSIVTQPTLTIDLMPPPSENGSMQCIYTDIGSELSNTGLSPVLPDDLHLYLKWGTMARMLNADGPAKDLERAEYCKARFEEGIEIARMMTGDFYV